MDAKNLLRQYVQTGTPLPYEAAYDLGVAAVDACRSKDVRLQAQTLALLTGLHTAPLYRKKGAAEQIAGICAAIFHHDIGWTKNWISPSTSSAVMEICGMGGDLVVTPNLSTIAAFIAVAGGHVVCKHGSPANADGGRHGSSDFIRLLGIDTFAPRTVLESCVKETGFGYSEALDTQYKVIHRNTHEFGGIPHMNDIIGPITNPVHPSILRRRILGVNHLIPVRVAAEAYSLMNEKGVTNMERLFVVRGSVGRHGVDEVSLCRGGTAVAELAATGEIREYRLHATDFGVREVAVEEVSPPTGMSKGTFSHGILFGSIHGGAAEMAVANAALLLHLGDQTIDLRKAFVVARRLLDDGCAARKAQEVQRILPFLG